MARAPREASGFAGCDKGLRESSIVHSKTEKRKGARKKGSPPAQHTHTSVPAVPSPLPTTLQTVPKYIGNGPGDIGATCTRGREGKGKGDAFARSDHHHKELKRE